MSLAPVVDVGLAGLRAAAARGDAGALEEAAVHFEALFVGMLLKSARSASLGEGLLDGADTRQYLEMMDAQVALDVARRGGVGFGRMLVEQLGAAPAPRTKALDSILEGRAFEVGPIRRPAPGAVSVEPGLARLAGKSGSAAKLGSAKLGSAKLGSAKLGSDPIFSGRKLGSDPIFSGERERFVQALLPHARRAAERLGVDPKLLVAQAALETGWGASVPRLADGRSTCNLFGLTAGSSWRGPTASTWTLEVVRGVPERRRADFRAYGSVAESFADYADVIARLPRYADALQSASDPDAYARAVAEAGYATDPDYADKWLAVYRSAAISAADETAPRHVAQESSAPADNAVVTGAHGGAAAPHEDRDDAGVLTAWMD